jgi:hypothetical protein
LAALVGVEGAFGGNMVASGAVAHESAGDMQASGETAGCAGRHLARRNPAARMEAISRRRSSGVMSIGSVAVSMLSSCLSTHDDLPFGTGALSGGLFGRGGWLTRALYC